MNQKNSVNRIRSFKWKRLILSLACLIAYSLASAATSNGMRDGIFLNSWNKSQQNLSLQIVAAREAGAFEALVQTLDALSLSLREVALLEASMQKVAESGQLFIHRLAKCRSDS